MSIEYARMLLALLLAAVVAGLAALLAVLANKVPVPSLWASVGNVTQNVTGQVQVPLSQSVGIGKFTSIPLVGLPSRLLNKTVLEIYGHTETPYLRVAVFDLFEGARWVRSRNIYTSPSSVINSRVCSTCRRVCYEIALLTPMSFLPHVKYLTSLQVLSSSGKVSISYYPDLDVIEVEPPQVRSYYACSELSQSTISQLRGLKLSDYSSLSISPTYLQVPKQDVGLLERFVKKIAGSCGQDVYCIVSRLVNYLRTHYVYSRFGAPLPSRGDVLRYLLYNATSLNCIQANTILALALRSIGIPTRIVVGFYVNPSTTYQKVTLSQLHAWTEIYDPRTGTWVRADATPSLESSGGRLRLQGSQRGSQTGSASENFPHISIDVFGNVLSQLERQNISSSGSISRTGGGPVRFLRVLVLGNFTRSGQWRTTYYDFYWSNMTRAYETYCNLFGYYLCRYVCYSVHTSRPMYYVPHVTVLTELRNVKTYIHYYGGDIVYVQRPGTYFSECSLELNSTFVLTHTPVSMYKIVKVPSTYLEVPFSDTVREELKERLMPLIHSCNDLACVIQKVQNFMSSNQLLLLVVKEKLENTLLGQLLSRDSHDNSLLRATLVALLLRIVGVPTRLVVGYKVHEDKLNLTYGVDVYVPTIPGLWITISPEAPSRGGGGSGKSRPPSTATYGIKYKAVVKVMRGSCTTLQIELVTLVPLDLNFDTHSPYIHVKPSRISLPAGKYSLKVKVCAAPRSPLGLSEVDILVRHGHRVDKHRLNVLVVARTRVFITYVFPRYIAPGYTIHVSGRVVDDLGEPVPSGTVVVTLNESKTSPGLVLCSGYVRNGTFDIACVVPQHLKTGKYLVAVHYEGSLLYLPSSSDPYIYITKNPLVPTVYVKCSDRPISIVAPLEGLAPEYETTLFMPCSRATLVIPTVPYFKGTPLCTGINATCVFNHSGKDITYKIVLRESEGLLEISYSGSPKFATFLVSIKLIRLLLDIRAAISHEIRLLDKIELRTFINCNSYVCRKEIKNLSIDLLFLYTSSANVKTYVMPVEWNISSISAPGYVVSKNVTLGVHNLSFIVKCVPRLYSSVIAIVKIGRELVSTVLARNVTVYSRLVVKSRYRTNKTSVLIEGVVVDPLARRANLSLPYPVRVCASTPRSKVCKSYPFRDAMANFSLVVPYSPYVRVSAYAPYHVKYTETIVIQSTPILRYIVAMLACICVLSLALLYLRYKVRTRKVALPGGEIVRRARVGQRQIEVRLVIENYDVLPNVWGLCETVRLRIHVLGADVGESEVLLRIGGTYADHGTYHEVRICAEGTYILKVLVRGVEVLSMRVHVIDYRKEIGRLYKDYVSAICRVADPEKLTPRQIAEHLLRAGYDEKTVKELTQIHEVATYSDKPVSRDVFIRFLTCLSVLGIDVSRRYS